MSHREASSLTWDRVKLDGDLPTFHIPADIAKNHNPMTFPITKALHQILTRRYVERTTKGKEYVFPAVRGDSGHMKDPRAMWEKVSEVAGLHLSNHDMRRTFEDVAKIVGIDGDTSRQLENHKASDVHGKHYANNPDPASLLPALEAISAWIVRQGEIAKAAASGENVIALRA